MSTPRPTDYFYDFTAYYYKALQLQKTNLASPTGRDVNWDPGFHDPLMQYVTIYDTVERRYAGFSNALQQVVFGSYNPKRWQVRPEFDRCYLSNEEMLWLCLFHRVTGSGASFSHDHGFRNSIVDEVAWVLSQNGTQTACQYVLAQLRSRRPIFTSIGNQIPPFPKPSGVYARGSELYFGEFMPELVSSMRGFVFDHRSQRLGIKQVVDFAVAWHRDQGLKAFHFVLTAWAMDIAEYFSDSVDPESHVYYGKNALESMGLMFEGFKKADAEPAMEMLMKATGNPEPMSLEDVLCDYVRYVEGFIPRGYDYLEPWQLENRSLVDHPVRHPSNANHVSRLRSA